LSKQDLHLYHAKTKTISSQYHQVFHWFLCRSSRRLERWCLHQDCCIRSRRGSILPPHLNP